MSDLFDKNWMRFVQSKNGKYYSKKNEHRLNYYEVHCAEYIQKNYKVLIEVYIQLIPTPGYSPFLERKTTITIEFNNCKSFQVKINRTPLFSIFFNNGKKIQSKNSTFNKKYLILGAPKNKIVSFISHTKFLENLMNLKLNNLEAVFDDNASRVLKIEFPGIIFENEKITLINEIVTHCTDYFSVYNDN